jgi:hypothetical protein
MTILKEGFKEIDSLYIYRHQEAFETGLIPVDDVAIIEVYDYDGDIPQYILMTLEQSERWEKERTKDFPDTHFIAPYYSEERLKMFRDVKERYDEMKGDIECIQADDPQYDCPTWWDMSEEYHKFINKVKAYEFKYNFY